MGKTTDQIKGRIKEAAGALTNDRDLKRDGKKDRLAGEVKEKLDQAKDKVEDVVDAAKDKVNQAKDKAEDKIDDAKDATHDGKPS